MIEAGSEHFDILTKSLRGERAVDEQTFSSLEILGERLGRLKKLSPVFEAVSFSPEIERLREAKNAIAVR